MSQFKYEKVFAPESKLIYVLNSWGFQGWRVVKISESYWDDKQQQSTIEVILERSY